MASEQLLPITEVLKQLVGNKKELSETMKEEEKNAEKRKVMLNSLEEQEEALDDMILYRPKKGLFLLPFRMQNVRN